MTELENAMSASQQSEPSASKPHASQPTAAGAPVKARSVDSSIPTDSPSPPASSVLSRQFEGLKLEDDGRISFHGPTSFFSIPNNTGNQPHHPENQSADDGDQLRHNALRQRTFEQLANLPNDPRIKRLLERYDNGEQFFREARTRLNDDLGYGHSRIPAVQTLLLMSAHECSRGHRTQAWLYSGMAFRLVDDMGISIDGRKYAGTAKFSSEDIEIRNRLFWSCYFWDKMISLYLGRPPTIQNSALIYQQRQRATSRPVPRQPQEMFPMSLPTEPYANTPYDFETLSLIPPFYADYSPNDHFDIGSSTNQVPSFDDSPEQYLF
ncbi:hypothetical protein DH86_00004037 [Scytalidium sp. 3C]|nr:hypothetical protein DH86_00004037 [Scytalidium sp. 3C]